jgi:hypothetical protein
VNKTAFSNVEVAVTPRMGQLTTVGLCGAERGTFH